MSHIFLLTSHFPYLPGEYFLETEVKYLVKNKDIQLTIIPIAKKGKRRDVDTAIEVDEFLIKLLINKRSRKPLDFIKFLFSKYFYNELLFYNLFSIERIQSFIYAINRYYKFYAAFDNFFKDKKDLDSAIVYTYWNNEATYALESLKTKYGYKLISRIHGYDLYEEVQKSNYMPLKRQFGEKIDKIFTITQKANKYLNKTYGIDYNNIELSRLGVEDCDIISMPNNKNILHIASCSNIVQVKRIDKIIKAIRILSKKQAHINFVWTHIGDGNLYKEILKLANEELSNLPNVEFEFKGVLDNRDVYQFYKNSKIDIFINVSESEGVPVSIMEAMSCHIPIIAPNVGGISDMIIDGVNGLLLSEKCEVNEIVRAINANEFYKKKMVRDASYEVFIEKYHSKINYEMFIKKIKNL